MEARVPTSEQTAMMSPVQVEFAAHELEFGRRRFEAASAMFMLRVDACGAYLADGHRRIAAWGRATNNWSTAESMKMAKLARAFKALPRFAQSCLEGRIGVAQMHAVAAVVANPRVKEFLEGADELFTTSPATESRVAANGFSTGTAFWPPSSVLPHPSENKRNIMIPASYRRNTVGRHLYSNGMEIVAYAVHSGRNGQNGEAKFTVDRQPCSLEDPKGILLRSLVKFVTNDSASIGGMARGSQEDGQGASEIGSQKAPYASTHSPSQVVLTCF